MKNLAIITVFALVCATNLSAQTSAITGVVVYDGTGGSPLADAVILVADGRISCLGSAETCVVPEGVRTVDFSGRFVTPGLVDAHVHFNQTGWVDGRPDVRNLSGHYDYPALQRSLRANADRWHGAYLCSGITSVFDVGGPDWTLELEADAEQEPQSARVKAAGPLLTWFDRVFSIFLANGSNTFFPMQTDAEAVESVNQLANMGSEYVKVWYLNPPEEQREALDARLLRIGEEARAHGLRLIVHATELRNAKLAIRAGAFMLVHSVSDQLLDDEFIDLARQQGTIYVPTLLVGRNWTRAMASIGFGVVSSLDDPNNYVDPETKRVIAQAPEFQNDLSAAFRTPVSLFSTLEGVGRAQATLDANLLRVFNAGIPIATGTDAGNPLTVHGPSIYAEMEQMEATGIPPQDILVMSTRNGAMAMGRSDFGTLELGKWADLIVLTEDPGISTSAFRSITHVMRAGEMNEISHYSFE